MTPLTSAPPLPADGRRRVVVENLTPVVDGGRFPSKRIAGDSVRVEADVFADGHDRVAATLLYRHESEFPWHKVPMRPLGNDRWMADFTAERLGSYLYTVEGRIDHFVTWRADLRTRFEARQNLATDREIGALLLEATAGRAGRLDAERLRELAAALREAPDDAAALALAEEEEAAELMAIHADPELVTGDAPQLSLSVERERARFSTWYELFPRSCCRDGDNHGTFAECERLLPEIARMGFDVVYFPPIHPIGRTHRKGRNNAPAAEEEDPGSPWAIGALEGGHTAIHPELGTPEDFEHFLAAARGHGIEVALDLAFQCSPDHPYREAHPEWFRWRPDGTVQYAENPPKKYQDIIPFDFENGDWQDLWQELLDVVRFWVDCGIAIFRVDNPHTKPFAFWEWLIAAVRREHPEVIFLAEAFTRPKVMYRLAKGGFSQSYTYFSWRNTRAELEAYLRELSSAPLRDFFRPNFWPNTPDILPEILQIGGRPAFVIRLLLAATLSPSYGIYGPPFELAVDDALPGQEEYLDSEKYQLRCWNWNDPGHLRDLIARVNRIRHQHRALQTGEGLRFCASDNDQLICYTRSAGNEVLLVAVSLDPFAPQEGRVRLPLSELGLSAVEPFLVHDLLGDQKAIWHGAEHVLSFDPAALPGAVFRLHRRLRREQDFDYYFK